MTSGRPVSRVWLGVVATPCPRALTGPRTPNEQDLSFQELSASHATFDSGEGVVATPCHTLKRWRSNGSDE